MKKISTFLLIILGLFLLFAVNYLLFTGALQGLPPAVEAALKGDGEIQVTVDRNQLVIEPKTGAQVGLLMFGEGKEDVRTYAPISRMLANAGVKVVFMSRRLEMRVSEEKLFGRIAAVLAENPALDWYIGGHTSGARIPLKYAINHIDNFEGIVLWAPRLSEESDISEVKVPVIFIYGTLDDDNVNLVENNKIYVPPQTEWISIQGANRADFSYWGPMAADVGSTISKPEIQKQAADATIQFIFE